MGTILQFPRRTCKPVGECPDDALGEARYRVADLRMRLSFTPVGSREHAVTQIKLDWWETHLRSLLSITEGGAEVRAMDSANVQGVLNHIAHIENVMPTLNQLGQELAKVMLASLKRELVTHSMATSLEGRA